MVEGLNELAVSTAKKLGVDDAVALTSEGNERMVRFANNSLTVTKYTKETDLYVYLGKDRRRIVAATSNPDEESVRTFVKKLFDSLQSLPEGSDYASLPEKARHYKPREEGYDRKIEAVGTELSELAGEAIESARKNGGERSAGALVECAERCANGHLSIAERVPGEAKTRIP